MSTDKKLIDFNELMKESENTVLRELYRIQDNNYTIGTNDNSIQTVLPPYGFYQPPVINITISPVINTTSETKKKTKNSPLRELGNVLSFLPNLFRG